MSGYSQPVLLNGDLIITRTVILTTITINAFVLKQYCSRVHYLIHVSERATPCSKYSRGECSFNVWLERMAQRGMALGRGGVWIRSSRS